MWFGKMDGLGWVMDEMGSGYTGQLSNWVKYVGSKRGWVDRYLLAPLFYYKEQIIYRLFVSLLRVQIV